MVFEFRLLEKCRCRCILFLGLGQTKIFIENVLEVFLVNKLSVIGKHNRRVNISNLDWLTCLFPGAGLSFP